MSKPSPRATNSDPNARAREFALALDGSEINDYASERLKLSPSLSRHFPYPPENPLVWVKFGRQPEAEMQWLAWKWLQREGNSAICAPEVYKLLGSGDFMYIVMELLDAKLLNGSHSYPMDECFNLIADGIQLLRRMPVPDDATPGPYTGEATPRRMGHPIFRDNRARHAYRSVDELEAHLNRVSGFPARIPYILC